MPNKRHTAEPRPASRSAPESAPEPRAIAQECTQALVVAGQGGSGYALGDTISLGNSVVVKATTMTGNAVASVTIVNAGSATSPPANPVSQVSTSGTGTGAKFNLSWAAVYDVFPGFTPIYPPPLVGQGGGPPPAFPPPTPPPIGAIPPGILAGPAIAAAGVPPSIAGVVQPTYKTGSATVPTAASVFPTFTTTFPNPPITVSNIWTIPTHTGGVWASTLPAAIVTTPCVAMGGWGPPGPSGLGPGAPTYPNPPGAGLPHLAEVEAEEDGHVGAAAAEDEPLAADNPPPMTRKRNHHRSHHAR